MKKVIFILTTLIPILNYAVEIEHSLTAVGMEPAYQFEVIDPLFPPFYADGDGEYPEDGYSYMWHTDEGHVSNLEKPTFFFSTSGSHDVYLTLTPRKKGDDELKVFFTYSFTVESSTDSPASNGSIADVDMYVDGEARMGDKVYVVVPLDPCQSVGMTHNYKVGFDQTKLKYSALLAQSNLGFTGIVAADDMIFGLDLNETVNFSYNWSVSRDDVAAVIEFDVLADTRESIPLKFYKADAAGCDHDVEILFSSIAGPYDPNYKESDIAEVNVFENPAKKTNPTEVLYTIHFQNIGEAPVDSITIFDILPDYLTFTSFEGSSESSMIVNTSQSGDSLMWVIAPNADIKGTNESPTQPEPSTKGWVQFKAEISKEEDIIYDTCFCLVNIATIYFDSLDPISTKADIIAIGDSLCFSPSSIVQGKSNAQTICDYDIDSSGFSFSRKKRIDSKIANTQFIAYPNPSKEAFQLKGEVENIQGVEILNSLGQVILPLASYKGSINLNDQPKGLYFIRVMTEKEQQVIRVEKY